MLALTHNIHPLPCPHHSSLLNRNDDADVFNALDLMENEKVFSSLQFGAGDGWLQYYVYNWKCPTMKSEEVGLVLL
ncbi:hypothetical protein EON63_06450 [archaeon]|nr:MAG: hypothetical protein EON63_06450 [archaeon]